MSLFTKTFVKMWQKVFKEMILVFFVSLYFWIDINIVNFQIIFLHPFLLSNILVFSFKISMGTLQSQRRATAPKKKTICFFSSVCCDDDDCLICNWHFYEDDDFWWVDGKGGEEGAAHRKWMKRQEEWAKGNYSVSRLPRLQGESQEMHEAQM